MIFDNQQVKHPAFDKTRRSDSTFNQSNDSMRHMSSSKLGLNKTDKTQEIK